MTSLPPDWRNAFSQLSLLDTEALHAPKPEGATKTSRRRGRPRGSPYERHILEWAGYYRCVTTTQVIWRFWGAYGKATRYGHSLVRRLQDDGLLSITPLDPTRGSASQRIIRLTLEGWRRLGVHPPADALRDVPTHVLQYRLQFAETMMTREAEGWRWMDRIAVGEALRTAALARFRGRVLTGEEQALRDAMTGRAAPVMPVHGLRHAQHGAIRLLLPARRGQSARRLLDRLPEDLRVMAPSLEVEIVATGHEELKAAQRHLQAKGLSLQVHLHPFAAPHYSLRRLG